MSLRPIDTHSQKSQQSHELPDSQSTTTNDSPNDEQENESIESTTAVTPDAAATITPTTTTTETATADETKDQPPHQQHQQSIANSPTAHEHLKEHEKFQPIKLMKQKFTFTANRTRKKRSNV